MSTQNALVPYQNDTYDAGAASRQHKVNAAPPRHTPFLVQLMVECEPALRRRLGRTDLADARVAAYARPAAQPALQRITDA